MKSKIDFGPRKLVLCFLLVAVICGSVIAVLLNHKPYKIESYPDFSVSAITQTDFFSFIDSFQLQKQFVNYLNLPQAEYDKYEYLRIDYTEACDEFNIPVRYGALLIVNYSSKQIERVVPFVNNSSYNIGFSEYSFHGAGVNCNAETEYLLYIGVDVVVAKKTAFRRIIERSDNYYSFRWHAPSGLIFREGSTDIFQP